MLVEMRNSEPARSLLILKDNLMKKLIELADAVCLSGYCVLACCTFYHYLQHQPQLWV